MISFSAAIRRGAKMSAQVFGRNRGPNGGTCANSAALLAIGKLYDNNCAWTTDFFPIARLKMDGRCPEGCKPPLSTTKVSWAVTHLNDIHCWTREKIADWVQTVEQQHPEIGGYEPQEQ